MSGNAEQHTKIEKRLEFIFQNISEQLKFSESKNLSISLISVGVLTVLFTYIPKFDEIDKIYFLIVIYMTACIFISILISVSSFSSRTKVQDILVGRIPKSSGSNLIFFAHIAGLDEKKYLDEFIGSNSDQDAERYLKELSHQIVALSRITNRKFLLFNLSLWFFVAAFLSPIGAYLLLNSYLDEAI